MNEAKFETLSGLAKMEPKDIALLFYETGFDTFYTALSGCNESVRIAILKNVSRRTREIMQEELQLRASPEWVFIEQALEEIKDVSNEDEDSLPKIEPDRNQNNIHYTIINELY